MVNHVKHYEPAEIVVAIETNGIYCHNCEFLEDDTCKVTGDDLFCGIGIDGKEMPVRTEECQENEKALKNLRKGNK